MKWGVPVSHAFAGCAAVFWIVLDAGLAVGDTRYADSTLPADITDGTYSAQKRSGGGKDGSAYRTIQAAVETMEPGDTLLLRGGVFKETDIKLVRKGGGHRVLRGRPDKWLTIRSHPGEWAVVDGGHREQWDDQKKAIKTFSVFCTSGAGENRVGYWRFEWFEVTGGGPTLKSPDGKERTYGDIQPLTGKGFHFWPGDHIVFDHLYIHDNYGGGGPNGGAGISIANEAVAAQHITVTHCWLRSNGWPGSDNGNLANIVFFADYRHRRFPDIDLDRACSRNEVSYNLLEDSASGFKHKSTQYLCLNKEATDMRAKDRGDRIHHNVIRRCHVAVKANQDFCHVYNNLVIDCPNGIYSGDPPSNGYRDLFHVLFHNNTLIGCKNSLTLWRGGEESMHNYPPPAHPHFHCFNNIIVDSSVDVHTEAAPLRIFPTYTKPLETDMKTVDVARNLFFGRRADQPAIRLAEQNLSAAQWTGRGWGGPLWAAPANPGRPLFQGAEGAAALKAKGDYLLPASDGSPAPATVADAGRGGEHPYLVGVTMPRYLGAVDPADGAWVDEVESLSNLGKTLLAPRADQNRMSIHRQQTTP